MIGVSKTTNLWDRMNLGTFKSPDKPRTGSYGLYDIANSVVSKGTQPGVAGTAGQSTKSGAEVAKDNFENTLNGYFEKRRKNLEEQKSSDARMARVTALGNILTSLVQPIGWAIGGKGSGVTGGVQPYDNRQYLEAFGRAVKASDDLRNLGASEDEYKLKMAYDEYTRAANEEDYRKRRELDAEYGVNRAKTGQALNEERKSKAIDAWTIHNNGMTLWQYINNINAMFPGYFGNEWQPNKEEIDRIEAEIRSNKPISAKPKTQNPKGGSSNVKNPRPSFNVGGGTVDKSSVTMS